MLPFTRVEENEMNKNGFTVFVQGKRIPVTEDVYKAFYRCREKDKYHVKRAKTKEISLEYLNDIGFPIESHVVKSAKRIEDIVAEKEIMDAVQEYLPTMSEIEQCVVEKCYFEGKTEEEAAREIGITQSGVNKVKSRSIKKLKEIFKILS